MSITFKTLSTETLKVLLADLRKQEKVLADKVVEATAALTSVQADIKSIEQAITPRVELYSQRTVKIRSDSDYGKWYTVSRGWKTNGIIGYTCECPSFIFASGTDENGYCKHILRAISRGGWA